MQKPDEPARGASKGEEYLLVPPCDLFLEEALDKAAKEDVEDSKASSFIFSIAVDKRDLLNRRESVPGVTKSSCFKLSGKVNEAWARYDSRRFVVTNSATEVCAARAAESEEILLSNSDGLDGRYPSSFNCSNRAERN